MLYDSFCNAEKFKFGECENSWLNGLMDAAVLIDESARVTAVNKKMLQMTGLGPEEIIGKNINGIKASPPLILAIDNWDAEKKDTWGVRVRGKNHAYDCQMKCCPVKAALDNGARKMIIFVENDEIKELASNISGEFKAYYTFDHIIASSPAMKKAVDQAKKASELYGRAPILIEGESGTGKKVLAQAIHNNSKRKHHPFVPVNCEATSRELIENEIFGSMEGGSIDFSLGRGGIRNLWQIAQGGTLFIDDISYMPLSTQARLCQAILESRRLMREAGDSVMGVQLTATTTKDLVTEVQGGRFLKDLLDQFNGVHIKSPALRERPEDIPLLVDYFIKSRRDLVQKRSIKVTQEAKEFLMEQHWKGNIRKLYDVLERIIVFSEKTGEIAPEDIPKEHLNVDSILSVMPDRKNEIMTLEEVTAQYIAAVLEMNGGNIKKTAEILDISRATVYRILKRSQFL